MREVVDKDRRHDPLLRDPNAVQANQIYVRHVGGVV